ncbi:MAG: cytochrome ubiquinol oxidase subunit I, partial [Campylobacterota bacterium]|nr:cytochrome ubiquinol oxidase subunit I [Campylobacterota bacterium]
IEIPYALSILGHHQMDAYIPGLNDLVYGNKQHNIISTQEKMDAGKIAVNALKDYKNAKKNGHENQMKLSRELLEKNMRYFGYGHLKKAEDVVPNVAVVFYAFHIMVILGGWFVTLFALILFFLTKRDIQRSRWLLYAALFTIPLAYVASEAGWVVAEVGRQPWAIQDLMLVGVAATHIATTNVMFSFFLFATLFTILLIAEIKIMLARIKSGFNGDH